MLLLRQFEPEKVNFHAELTGERVKKEVMD